jgi:hypothetical protein
MGLQSADWMARPMDVAKAVRWVEMKADWKAD